MSATREMQITLSAELTARVREIMATGRYASENEVITESLSALVERDADIETWLIEDVGPAFDRWAADPARAIPLDEAFADLDKQITE